MQSEILHEFTTLYAKRGIKPICLVYCRNPLCVHAYIFYVYIFYAKRDPPYIISCLSVQNKIINWKQKSKFTTVWCWCW